MAEIDPVLEADLELSWSLNEQDNMCRVKTQTLSAVLARLRKAERERDEACAMLEEAERLIFDMSALLQPVGHVSARAKVEAARAFLAKLDARATGGKDG